MRRLPIRKPSLTATSLHPNRRKILKSIGSGLLLSSQLRPGLALGADRSPAIPQDQNGVVWLSDAAARATQDAFNLRTALPPQYRALCLDNDGVTRALNWALENDIPFSIRSGGHCFEGLSQSLGLVIDLRRMNKIAIMGDSRLTVQPGANLGQINSATGATDQVLPAGFCQGVAIGGHVGGGGLGLLSRAYGLTCDHLLSARVLTADLRTIDASPDEHADLFWALRGGGSGSFGIVVSMTFRLQQVSQPAMAEADWLLAPQEAAKLIETWQRLTQDLDRKISAFLFIQARPNGGIHLRTRLIASAPSSDLQRLVERLTLAAPSIVEPIFIRRTFPELADRLWPRTHNPKEYTKHASNFLPGPVDGKIWLEVLSELDAARESNQGITLEALGGAIDDLAPDATAYIHRGKSAFIVHFQTNTPSNHGFEDKISTMRDIQRHLLPATMSGAYVNYPDLDLPDWKQSYWGENYPRLSSIKKTYDPRNIFNHAQSVRPST